MATAEQGEPRTPSISQPVSTATLMAYTLPSIPVHFIYNLVVVMYLYFATVELGLSPAIVGTIFFASKVWDAISDPMAGFLSDRTTSRLGRRRSWLLASSLPLGLFAWALWSPPGALEGRALEVWIAVAVFGFYTAYTAFEVPHMSLGAELTMDRVERNRVFGARQLARVATMLLAYTGGVMVVRSGGAEATGWMATGVAVILVLAVVWGVFRLPPERADFQGRGAENPVRAVVDVWTNPHARLLLFVFFIESIGSGGIGVLVPFVIQYVMKLTHPLALPGLLMAFVGSSLIGIPFWVRLARRYEKRRLWLYAMVQAGVGFGLIFWVGEGDWVLMTIAGLMAGTASSCGATLGQALKADIIDVDEHRTGQRKEGAYFSAWTFMNKLAGGVMVWIVGLALGASGFDRELPDQLPAVKEVMILLMGGIPLVGYAIGALAFSRFSLSEADHARIRAELDERVLGG